MTDKNNCTMYNLKEEMEKAGNCNFVCLRKKIMIRAMILKKTPESQNNQNRKVFVKTNM